MSLVISQPMLFPWVGMLEQVRLADVYVDYPDVQFSKGGFVNRVQIKTAAGPTWCTVPLRDRHLGQRIDETLIDERRGWRTAHRRLLREAYDCAPFRDEVLALVDSVYEAAYPDIGSLSLASLRALCDYFGLTSGTRFEDSRNLGVAGTSSRRVLDIALVLGQDRYITGHGARRYLDHELFEAAGVRVEYMDYRKRPYPQLHGEFTPYVSALDLVANVGRDGSDCICSGSLYWKEFLSDR